MGYIKDEGSTAAQIHGKLNNASWESSMGSGAVLEQNAADGAARQLFIYYIIAQRKKTRVRHGNLPCWLRFYEYALDSPPPVYVHFRFELFELLMLQQRIFKRRRLHSSTSPWKAE